MGIQLEKRNDNATEVQKVLTAYGCFIKTRVGLHNASDHGKICSEKGLILLEFIMDAEKEVEEIQRKLENIEGVIVRKMEF
ncbi:MAG: hypothetical protein N4A62_11790 [Marinisporobacter sp.]|jgi:hypothetical protein|nr:hypothetical protein [Marinisporobacter sp.]